MSHHLTEARDVRYTYPDGTRALDGVTFRIGHGESVGVIGANGAGKSTLLLLLLGVLLADSGEVRVGDMTVTKRTLPHIREHVGMVFQDPDDQLFMGTVFEDVAFGPRNLGLEEPEVERRVALALATVGISHLRDRAPYRLSGGEKRAAGIATVLSMEPDILVLDEPTAGLDPKARRRVIGLLRGFDHTRIVTSHDLDMVLDVCTRVIVLADGRVAADGPSDEILRDESLLLACGLELPLSLQKEKKSH
jgi:cobalt/nickel transport system ATP-binding protein